MLNILRHKGFARKVLWGVAVIIILSFGVFGTAYNLDNNLNSAGKIFNQSVPLRDFEQAYLDSRDQAILTYGDRFFKLGQKLDLEGEAWSRLILLRQAKKEGILVTDQEVVEYIAGISFFQREGKFDQKLYESIVANRSVFDRLPKDFENGIRGALVIRKLLDQAAGPALITEDDLKKEYIKRHEKITLSYLLFSPENYRQGLTASDDEAIAYYNSHKENFRLPPMVNVQYVHLFNPDKATDTQKESVKKDAVAISHELNPKADFAAIAQKYHTGLKESGFFTQEQPLLTFAWSPEFVDKIFTMKTNEISSPMESPDGWQIIKIKEIKASGVPEYTAIVDKVKNAAIDQKALNAAGSKAAQALKAIETDITAKGFKAVVDGLGLTAQETTAFSRGEYISAPGLVAEFQEESLKLNESRKLSGIVPTSQGPAILFLSKTETIEDKKFTEDKEDFRQMMSAQKHSEAMAKYVNKVKLEANLKSDLKGKIRYR